MAGGENLKGHLEMLAEQALQALHPYLPITPISSSPHLRQAGGLMQVLPALEEVAGAHHLMHQHALPVPA